MLFLIFFKIFAMANWIKIMTSLRRSPKVMQLGSVLKVDRLKALGAAVDWFCWVDEQCADGSTYLTPKQLDEVLGIKRMCEALVRVGWACVGDDGLVCVTDFDQHNGETAKTRAQAARRQERFRGNAGGVTGSNGAGVTAALENALPRIDNSNIDTKGELSTTVDIGAAAVPSPPARDGFFGWLAQIGVVVPMLRRLNLDRPLPRKVEAAARQAAGLVRLTPEVLEQLQRYYAADSVSSYRPNSLEFFFGDLPDVLQHAANFCRAEDARMRKEAATARRKAMEREQCQNARTGSSGACSEADREAFFKEVRGGEMNQG